MEMEIVCWFSVADFHVCQPSMPSRRRITSFGFLKLLLWTHVVLESSRLNVEGVSVLWIAQMKAQISMAGFHEVPAEITETDISKPQQTRPKLFA